MIEGAKPEDLKAELQQTAYVFLEASFAVLTEEGVLPRSPYIPYVSVGQDYFGDSIHGMSAYIKFESLLNKVYPDRFGEPRTKKFPEFSSLYIFSFLSAAIANFGAGSLPIAVQNGSVKKCIDELFSVLDEAEIEVVCCREVSHLTTFTGEVLSFGRFTIIPSPKGVGGPRLSDIANTLIPGAYGAYGRNRPFHYDPPSSLVVVRIKTKTDPWEQANSLSAEIDRLLLRIHLLQAATCESIWQVYGASTLVSQISPQYKYYPGSSSRSPMRRTAVLSDSEIKSHEALSKILSGVDVQRKGMVTTSFDMAIHRYVRTYDTKDDFDQIVDLATSLEAILTGNDQSSDAISLRLRNRASALLSTPKDSAEEIFKDIGLFYNLRSLLVHGGSIKQKDLKREIMKISTVSNSEAYGLALARGVDRLRDLVRRSILARIALGEGNFPLWPLIQNIPVDLELSSDEGRTKWRSAWRTHLEQQGLGQYIDESRKANTFFSLDDE